MSLKDRNQKDSSLRSISNAKSDKIMHSNKNKFDKEDEK